MSDSPESSHIDLDQTSLGRLNLLFAILLLAVAMLGVRLAMMVRTGQAAAAIYVERQQQVVLPIPARPGGIWGRSRQSYRLLAGSKQAPACFVDPSLLADADIAGVANQLADALSLPRAEVRQMVLDRRDKRFAWIKHDLTLAEVEATSAIGSAAIGLTHEWWREYPNGSLAATVLGFRQRDGQPGGGLELSQRRHLASKDGREVAVADAQRRPVWVASDKTRPPVDGHDVYLTLDVTIQSFLSEAVLEAVSTHDAKWGTGVVIEPSTGRVLAMCSAPTFDPVAYNTSSADQRTNRAISTPFEPGSVAKPLFAAAAVEAGVATYDSIIECQDGFYNAHRGGRISDHGKSYGPISLEDVVVYSSNIGMAKIGERLGNERLHAISKRFGFGDRTDIGLPGESPGIIRPAQQMDGYSLRRVPFGQEMSTSALQLAMAFGALANGGLLLKPQLVDHVRDSEGEVIWRGGREVVRRVVSPATARASLVVLEQVVLRGTGKKCQLDNWSSFGKTGTAQIAGPGGYVDNAYTGTFVGGAPTRAPRVICLISVYWPDSAKGYYGSVVSAPYVRRVLHRTLTYLNVPADAAPLSAASR